MSFTLSNDNGKASGSIDNYGSPNAKNPFGQSDEESDSEFDSKCDVSTEEKDIGKSESQLADEIVSHNDISPSIPTNQQANEIQMNADDGVATHSPQVDEISLAMKSMSVGSKTPENDLLGRKTRIQVGHSKYTNMEDEIERKLCVNLDKIIFPHSPAVNLSEMKETDKIKYIYAWLEIQHFARVKELAKTNLKAAIILFHAVVEYYGQSGTELWKFSRQSRILKRTSTHLNTAALEADSKLKQKQQEGLKYCEVAIPVHSGKVDEIEYNLILSADLLEHKPNELWNEKIDLCESNFQIAFSTLCDMVQHARINDLTRCGLPLSPQKLLMPDMLVNVFDTPNLKNECLRIFKQLFEGIQIDDYLQSNENRTDFDIQYEGKRMIVWYSESDEKFKALLNKIEARDLYPKSVREFTEQHSSPSLRYILGIPEKTDDVSTYQSTLDPAFISILNITTDSGERLKVNAHSVGLCVNQHIHNQQQPRVVMVGRKVIIFIQDKRLEAKYDCLVNAYYDEDYGGPLIVDKHKREGILVFHKNQLIRMLLRGSKASRQRYATVLITKQGIKIRERFGEKIAERDH